MLGQYHHASASCLIGCEVKTIIIKEQITVQLSTKVALCLLLMDISNALKNLGVEEFHANFSASGHGNSEVDSAAGGANTQAKHAVIPKHITINDAETFYDFCKSTIEAKPIVQGLMKKPTTLHARRSFLLTQMKLTAPEILKTMELKAFKATLF